MRDVVIQVPAFREPNIDTTLDSLLTQARASPHRVHVEAWITPSDDNATWHRARDVDGVTVQWTPPGKLSARNRAHDAALFGDARVIVQADADVDPRPGALDALLAPLQDDARDVVATNGYPRKPRSVTGAIVGLAARLEDSVRPHLHGQFSAFTTAAWKRAGPFDDTIDQRSIKQVRREEEFRFRERLEAIGQVAEPDGAVVVDDLRRHRCSIGDAFAWSGRRRAPWCERRGAETFQPGKRQRRP